MKLPCGLKVDEEKGNRLLVLKLQIPKKNPLFTFTSYESIHTLVIF